MAHTFVKDVMRKNIISIDQDMTIKDAAVMMDDSNVGCVIVTNKNAPIGILTERDFVKRVSAKEKPLSTRLSEVMSTPLITVSDDETIWEAAEIMKKNKIHKMPVQQNNKIVGILTASDIVKICSLGSDSSMREICDQILLRISKN
ncbi:MAG: CBS domain-containing protein [Thaumarchaeota archaeon]|nr:CBS domain-containing protein [Nitrososphaerota archaeon]